MEAYLDNSATTKVSDGVRDIVVKTMTEDFGNPSSLHMKGIEAEKYLRDAREIIAKALKVTEKEIIFTSGGTEANNMALIGVAEAYKRAGRHIITTAIEHASVLDTMKYLTEQGYSVTYLNVDKSGRIDLGELKNAITDETILVSVMYVNNEIGAVEPIEEIGKIIKERNPNTVFHVDAIQAFGKYKIYPKKLKIDALSVSGHKIHGPKGIGFLYVSDKVKIRPIIHGGGQQRGLRSGTDNVPGIAGMGQAVREAYTDMETKADKMRKLKDYLTDSLLKLSDVRINSSKGDDGAPNIVSASFIGVRSEVMLHALEEKGVYVSSGSACSSNKPGISATLKSIGLNKEALDSTLRFSFCDTTTMEEIDYALEAVKELLPKLRVLRRK